MIVKNTSILNIEQYPNGHCQNVMQSDPKSEANEERVRVKEFREWLIIFFTTDCLIKSRLLH